MRFSRFAATLIATVVTLPAFAEEAASPIAGNFTLASEYIYRGIAQTNRKPAVQGGLDYAGPAGLYLGAWGSNISWLSDACGAGSSCAGPTSAPVELDFYGGIKVPVGPVTLDFGGLHYYYPGTYAAGTISPNTWEVYGAASWNVVTFKYSYSLTNLFGWVSTQEDGSLKKSTGSQYLDLSANPELPGGVVLNLHVGRQLVANLPSASYNDWKIGVTKALLGWNWAVAYIGTDARAGITASGGSMPYLNAFNRDMGGDRVVLSVGKSF